MSSQDPETTGRLDDTAEDQEPSSTTDGPAADGEYDPAQGSPGQAHPVGETFPDEAPKAGESD